MSERWGHTPGHELPCSKQPSMRLAVRVEQVSLFFFVTAIAFTAFVMGESQAMKTVWIDDMLGMVPPVAVLIAARLRRRRATDAYRYGYHRAVTIAFLVAAVALLGFGVYLLGESLYTLIRAERPTIGTATVFGRDLWLGWLMLAALAWSAVPTVILGRIKLRLAEDLHDKALYTDALMNKADWMTGAAGVLGVMGIGLGYWWADAAAACAIAIDITHDGGRNLIAAFGDLMDRRPRDVACRCDDPVPERLAAELAALPWVRRASVRLREHGHVLIGEVYVVPVDEAEPLRRIEQVGEVARALDWRLTDLTVQLVPALTREDDDRGCED
ncbi:Divalent metal cation (Fe/Co/Zn/Cd) transporter [Nannocystis exedens]|uniref:Divalent metal cation (Fe/Co/Zn/Cd) transporter n=1 Tax=Nannocystis exedens TaxID=54 RepID=A0A1I1Y6J7_9BACT|nr:cation transporter [Nannocystis exedens]PCC71850.1 Cation efflux family protein [Nannocystis exedens]SFE15201.1 Divalent metal cation (Fe/Co/Zn/Cd) transporter [Nannocystis exedens]